MKTKTPLSSMLRNILERPNGGVVGLCDDVLRLCRQENLQLDWQTDSCRVQSLDNGQEEVIDKPVSKPVFRALLARIANLCNEHRPGSVSPYGGQGNLSVGDPVTSFHVSFANTPDEQWLVLRPLDGPDDQR